MADNADVTPLKVALAVDNGRIQLLQAGRAVAALLVVAHHAEQAVSTIVPSAGAESGYRKFCEYGYLGVDFFFVLSGFIIYYSTSVSKKKQAPSNYFWSRVNRIYTPYLPIGIAYAVLYTLLPAASQGNRDWGWFTSLTLLPSDRSPALSVAWTLRHEVIFYFLFGVLFFLRKLNSGFLLWSVLIAVYVAVVHDKTALPGAWRQLLIPINLEFGFGYLAALSVIKGLRVPFTFNLLGAVSGTLLWVWLGADRSQSWLIGMAIAFLMLAGVQWEREGKLRIHHRLIFLGDASYSIYLIHPPVIAVLSRILTGRITSELTVMGVLFPASVLAGCAWHLLYERRVTAYFRRTLSGG